MAAKKKRPDPRTRIEVEPVVAEALERVAREYKMQLADHYLALENLTPASGSNVPGKGARRNADTVALTLMTAITSMDPVRLRAAREVGDRVAAHLAVNLALDDSVYISDPALLAQGITDLISLPTRREDGSSLIDAVAPLWTAEKTRAELGLSRASMSERRATGSLLGLKTTDGDFFYPVAQFERTVGGKVRVRPALRTFLMKLRDYDTWTIAVTLNTRADELEGG